MRVQDSNVVIMGMGKSGQAAAKLALARGAARVLCLDSNPDAVRVEGTLAHYGPHRRADIMGGPGGAWEQERPDFMVVSPGVPPTVDAMRDAATVGLPILGEIDFAARQCPPALPFVGITGTNGKSSTAWYTHQLLNQTGRRSYLGGNIGRPLSLLPLDIDQGQEVDVAVVELSSYQLERVGRFHPRVGVILNLTPDHLARHGTMADYGAAKLRLFENMDAQDVSILPPDTAALPTEHLSMRQPRPTLLWLGRQPGLEIRDTDLWLSGTSDDGPLSLAGFTLPGHHNRINAGVAALIAVSLGAQRAELDLSGLQALEHRMEWVHTQDGVQWINDSKATNVESTQAAIEGAPSPLILLVGGKGKAGANYSQLRPGLAASATAVICFGASADEIANALDGLPVHQVSEMREAIVLARRLAHSGDCILLSPACASFDEFLNFEERGHVFTRLARGTES
jgi:UDP-N-acetylmuramoylalanine--D-glutamate ligase